MLEEFHQETKFLQVFAVTLCPMRYALCDLLPGENFGGTDLVLEGIVAVCRFDAEGRVGVSGPASAEIEAFIDPPDPVFPADAQRGGVILAVAHVEKSDFAHQAGVESPRSAQAIDAQGIVVTVLIGPFAVVDESRRNLLQPGIDQGIGADHQGIGALTEHVDHLLQGLAAAVKIVRIQLDGIASAGLVMKGFVPATPDAKVCPLRDDVLRAWNVAVPRSERTEVVPSVEWLSTTRTLNGKSVSCDSALFTASAIVSFRFRTGMTTEASTGKEPVDCATSLEVMGRQISPDPFQVIREDRLHLLLGGLVSGIDVGK